MNKRKLVLSSAVANIFEWYDYALFGQFAPVLGSKFFPETDPNISILQAFFVFALGYFMRPVGGIFFGIIGDRFGRRTAFSAAVICMAFPTSAIGILPTYQSIGIAAPIAMIIARMLQGLSMGGTLTGSVSFIIEHTPKKHRGLVGSVPMASICIGILFGSTIALLVRSSLSEEQFTSWGWRVPFLLGIFIIFAGIYIRKYTEETPLFEEVKSKGALAQSPFKKVCSSYWVEICISILINSTGSVIFYLQAIYLMSYLKLNRHFLDMDVNRLASLCYIIMAVVAVAAGWLSDYIGRGRIFIILNLLIILSFSCGLMHSFETGSFQAIIYAQLLLAVLAAAYIGPEPALQAEFYPTNVRNTALSFSYNMATSIFGGTTPYVLELLTQQTHTIASCTYYVVSCSILSLIGLYFYQYRLAARRNKAD